MPCDVPSTRKRRTERPGMNVEWYAHREMHVAPLAVSTILFCVGAALVIACDDKSQVAAPAASAQVQPPPATPMIFREPPASCDADSLWFDGGAGNVKAYEASLRTWTPDCRATALRSLCQADCDEMISDHVIAASASPEEKKAAIGLRLELNTKALGKAKDFLKRAREIQRYALSIRGSPRSLDSSCTTRMHDDQARIDALREDANSLPNPLGGRSISLFADAARTCVSCGDDLSESCSDMNEPLKDMSDNLADWNKLVAADKRAVAAK